MSPLVHLFSILLKAQMLKTLVGYEQQEERNPGWCPVDTVLLLVHPTLWFNTLICPCFPSMSVPECLACNLCPRMSIKVSQILSGNFDGTESERQLKYPVAMNSLLVRCIRLGPLQQ